MITAEQARQRLADVTNSIDQEITDEIIGKIDAYIKRVIDTNEATSVDVGELLGTYPRVSLSRVRDILTAAPNSYTVDGTVISWEA